MASIAKAYAGMVADQQTSVRLSRLAEGAITATREAPVAWAGA